MGRLLCTLKLVVDIHSVGIGVSAGEVGLSLGGLSLLGFVDLGGFFALDFLSFGGGSGLL